MINLGVGEFYIKMTIDGESYDPFSAETLKVLPPTHPSYRERIIEASRRKYAVPVDEVKAIYEKEESTIVRSASEKAAVTRGNNDEANNNDNENNNNSNVVENEPLI